MEQNQNLFVIYKKIKAFFSKNYGYIFSIIGQLFILGIIVYLLYSITNYITNLKGFTFDPVLILAIVIVTYFYIQSQRKSQKIAVEQNNILNNLLLEVNQNKKVPAKEVKTFESQAKKTQLTFKLPKKKR